MQCAAVEFHWVKTDEAGQWLEATGDPETAPDIGPVEQIAVQVNEFVPRSPHGPALRIPAGAAPRIIGEFQPHLDSQDLSAASNVRKIETGTGGPMIRQNAS